MATSAVKIYICLVWVCMSIRLHISLVSTTLPSMFWLFSFYYRGQFAANR